MVLTVSSGRTIRVSSSGGPAMAAMALIGEPLTMKAIAGPEPSARSIESDAMACCIFASPANAIDSASQLLGGSCRRRCGGRECESRGDGTQSCSIHDDLLDCRPHYGLGKNASV